MSYHSSSVGFFGKLPCRGDFLHRRVRQEFVDVWDAWLQQCITESRQQLQDRWLEAYLTSPVWRFVLAEGVCGSGAYAGVMVPSVDRVGRYFPLTIVTQWNSDDCPLDIACSAQRWFYSAEALALTVPETTDFDVFDAQVERLANLIDPSGIAESTYLHSLMQHSEFPHGTRQWHVPLASVHSLQRAVNALAFRELERTMRPLSLWWTDGSDAIDPAWLCTRALPDPRSFAAMLAGEWPGHGWMTLDANAARARPRPPAPPVHSSGGALDGLVDAGHDQGAQPLMSFELERADPYAARPNPAYNAERNLFEAPRPVPYPLSDPQLSAPPVEIVASHEPLTRKWGAEATAGAYFVTRPELGLWGVTASDEKHSENSSAQMIADALHSVPPGGTLTTLVEEVRRTLDAARRQIARQSVVGASRARSRLRAIVLLARGAECALIYWGDVQAVRSRASQVAAIIGVADFDGAADTLVPLSRRTAENGNTLLDLVTGSLERPADDAADILVRYESLQLGDVWLLSGAPLFDEPQLAEIGAALMNAAFDSEQALASVRASCNEDVRSIRPLPVLLLASAHSAGEG